MARGLFAAVMAIHGLIHVMGFLKAFGLAQLPQLQLPISKAAGVAWLLAMLLVWGAVAALFVWPQGWWLLGGAGLLVSQGVIMAAWSDARFGSLANAILLVGVAYGALTQGPTSFRARFREDAQQGIQRVRALPAPAVITQEDVAALPPPVRRYLQVSGAVGQPRVLSYRLKFQGRIRGGPNDAWMDFVANQQSFTDPPERFFLMHASMAGVPVQAFHQFGKDGASMKVLVAGVFPMVDAHGPEMDRSETVTLFNDMCILAPGSLLSNAIAWDPMDGRHARARFTKGPHTITATLEFGEDGFLKDFISDDRSRASKDGRAFTPLRFSTPVREPHAFGPVTLAAVGEARWHAPPPEGEFTYGEFGLVEIAYNEVTPPELECVARVRQQGGGHGNAAAKLNKGA